MPVKACSRVDLTITSWRLPLNCSLNPEGVFPMYCTTENLSSRSRHSNCQSYHHRIDLGNISLVDPVQTVTSEVFTGGGLRFNLQSIPRQLHQSAFESSTIRINGIVSRSPAALVLSPRNRTTISSPTAGNASWSICSVSSMFASC